MHEKASLPGMERVAGRAATLFDHTV